MIAPQQRGDKPAADPDASRRDPRHEDLDILTALPGRQSFCADFAARLAEADRSAAVPLGGLCLIDIDNFRFLNAVAGTEAADLALQQIAALLRAELGPADLIGRSGDDEFAVLLSGLDPQAARAKVAAMLRGIAAHQLEWQGKRFKFSACAGLAVLVAGDTPENSLNLAMAACGTAKEAGRGSIVVAGAPDTDSGADRDLQYHRDARVLSGLQAAISEDRLRLYAQQIFNFAPGGDKTSEFELLVHMIDADGCEVPPSAIIPAAERHGYIRALDRWVIKAVLLDHAALLQRHPEVVLSLNLSGQSLADPELWPYVAGLFAQSGVPAQRIQFEITETSAISDMAVARRFVQAARAQGCKVALDDFGSGLSSFAYLRSFPVDCLKIDGAFVGNVTEASSADRAIVTAIVGVARALGLSLVAEHVDRTEVLSTLRGLGIDKIQGFLLSLPRPFCEILETKQA